MIMATVIKPTIHKAKSGQQYVCHDKHYIWGYGSTPKAAYDDWYEKQSRRTRIPRRGVWNRKSCMDWYRDGCNFIRYYIGNQQVFGYIPTTDELILRG